MSNRLSGKSIDRPAHGQIDGPGTFAVDVVGESQYQKNLEAICGGRTYDGTECFANATLILENDNSHDSKAVRVDIQGRTVGYLSRENARQFRKKLREAGHPAITTSCRAIIVGGWDRGNGDRGYFGVRLDLPTVD